MTFRTCNAAPSSSFRMASRLLWMIAITIIVPPPHLASGFIISIGNFLSADVLEDCKYFFQQADTVAPYDYIDANEYTRFIALWSDNIVNEERFIDLPFDLKLEFQFSGDWMDDGKLYIPIVDDTPSQEAYLSQTCSGIRYFIREYLPPTVSPSASPSLSNKPSASPTVSRPPSNFPIAAPSARPSDVPSVQPSASPTEVASAIPSSAPSNTPSLRPSSKPSHFPSVVPSTSPSAVHSSSPTMDGRVDIQFSYDITTDFITAPQLQLMNNNDGNNDDSSNTIWNDLIYATTTTLIPLLQDVRRMSSSHHHHHHDEHSNVQDRQYVRQRQRQLYQQQQQQEGEVAENGVLRHKQQHERELFEYDDNFPVQITSALPMSKCRIYSLLFVCVFVNSRSISHLSLSHTYI
uniref:Uncharacterized protein n=1 Tax=Ditylum brightwellii TaxID=49249 RepID=A0A7S4SCU4_9STRA